MSTEESDGGSVNFEILRTCLKTPCTKLLQNILKLKFKRYEELKEGVPLDTLSDRSKYVLERQNRVSKLNLPVLCDIFRSGAFESLIGLPVLGWFSIEEIPEEHIGIADEIQRIWRIWQKHIKDNEDETLSDNDSNIAMKTLMEIGFRMSKRRELKEFGVDFFREVGLACNEEPNFDAVQLGKKNSIEMNIDSSFNGCVNVIQGGHTNKIIIYEMHDNRRGEIQYTSTGRVQVSAVLHSDDPAFQAVTERASELNIEEINERPALRDNDTSIQEIRQGSLVITFTFRNDQSLEENIQRVFQCVFEDIKINEILEEQKVDTLEVFGYIYDPKEYFLDYATNVSTTRSEVGKFHLYTHLTWTFSECTCDIDIVLSELFHNLLSCDLTTEVNEDIWIILKGSIINPTDMALKPFESLLPKNMDDKMRKINLEFEKSGQCEIQSIQQEKSTTHVVLRTKSCISYSGLLLEDGILLSFLRIFLWSDESELLISKVQLMRIGLILHTKLAQNKELQQTDHTLIIKFCPESNITKAINKGALPEILTSVLQVSGIEVPDRMKIKVDINDQK
ncbi:uncharacterized protein LOC134280803, partial [Saccostrea cucullata]|uniref:uncharacterized protein LOC134280803 n=1 Tax=Saccostrea cuccullata TaxID=36930 RepID=UPI002ED37B18